MPLGTGVIIVVDSPPNQVIYITRHSGYGSPECLTNHARVP